MLVLPCHSATVPKSHFLSSLSLENSVRSFFLFFVLGCVAYCYVGLRPGISTSIYQLDHHLNAQSIDDSRTKWTQFAKSSHSFYFSKWLLYKFTLSPKVHDLLSRLWGVCLWYFACFLLVLSVIQCVFELSCYFGVIVCLNSCSDR